MPPRGQSHDCPLFSSADYAICVICGPYPRTPLNSYTLTGIMLLMSLAENDLAKDLRAKEAPEARLSRLWYDGGFARRGLRTRCGRRVKVLYRGLPNGERGPDYRGAVLSLGRGKPRSGDIELHVRSSQWRTHGHQRDPHYQGVILHVVWHDDDPNPTLLPNGRPVPVLALDSLNGREMAVLPDPCFIGAGRDLARLGQALDRAGDERFLARAARLEGDMAVLPIQEVLYQALAAAFGFSRNKVPLSQLAARFPLSVLQGFLWGKPSGLREPLAQALLMGAAGLLPFQRGLEAGEEWPAWLERLWEVSALEPQLAYDDWSCGVRPENHPVRRIAGLASLVVRSLPEGLVGWALAPLEQATCASVEPARCWRILVQEAGSYWRQHFDFGRAGRRLSPSLVGQERATEMAVNGVLPFAYAYGQVQDNEALSKLAKHAYWLLPSPGTNQITRHMERQLGVARHGLASTARRQQGMLHLFHNYCTRGRCGSCPD